MCLSSTSLDKKQLQEFLYYHNAKVPPMPILGKDEDGVPTFYAEGEQDAWKQVSLDIGVMAGFL